MLKVITRFDQWLFIKINSDGQNSFFDTVMPFLREPTFWIPLYFFLLLLLLINFKQKGWWAVAFTIITFAITDSFSSRVLKPLVGRIRPCGDPDFSFNVRLLAGCGGNGSFPSSHAVNHFGLAMFLFILLHSVAGKWAYLFFLWAAIISYAQVYVGVHYPTDVIGGAFIGCFLGWVTGTLFTKKIGQLIIPAV
jgi:membrane-associated phospholipid phosphatase